VPAGAAALKLETDPIADDEWLLRRVRVERFRTDNTPIISPNAFEPRVTGRDIDRDGISLFREACLSAATDILVTVAAEKRHENGIVRIPVSLLFDLKLTVVSSPDPRILGHVVIPELNAEAYQKDKARFTIIKLRLAEVASELANIVHRPSPAAK
jgi:hypothetical protein